MTSVATGSTESSARGVARLVDVAMNNRGVHGVVGLGVAWSIWSADDEGTVWCPFRRCTGGYCPACGATRGAARLARGDVAGSWAQHPIVVVLAVQALAVGVWALLRPSLRAEWRRRLAPVFAANLALLFVVWVVRLFLGSIPVPFA